MRKIAVILVLLPLVMCAPISYDFIGTWEKRGFTYVNQQQHIEVSLPDNQWKVYTEPIGDVRSIWHYPRKRDPSYHVLIARIERPAMLFQIVVEPVQREISLEDYMNISIARATKRNPDAEVVSHEIVERNGRKISLLRVRVKSMEGPHKMLAITRRETGRFTCLVFSCPETLFESQLKAFWIIADSYKYI